MTKPDLIAETYDQDLYADEGKVLDELVATGAAVHIERMSKRWWMVIVEVAGEYIHVNVRDLTMYERTRTKPPRGGGDGVGATNDPSPLGSIGGADGGRVILPTGPTPPGGVSQPRR